MNVVHTPEAHEELLWTRRRPPVLLRCLIIPLGLVFGGFPILAAVSPAVNFTSTTAAWIGTAGLVLLGVMFLEASFFRGDIRFNPATRDLVFTSSGLFRYQDRFPTADATAIEFYHPRRAFGGSPQLLLHLRDGHRVFLSYLAPSDADGAPRAISGALNIRAIHS